MKVGDQLSLYTELYGWIYYGVIWEILVASGLVFMPFAVIVIGHLRDQRERNSSWGAESDSILSGLEAKLFVALIVVLIAAVPTIAVTPQSFSFDRKADVFIGAAQNAQVQGGTDTTLDQAVASPVAGATVNVPAFWYAVSAISHGITYAVRSQVDEKGKAFTAIKRAADLLSTPEPEIQVALQRFHSECYAPALKMYRDDSAERPVLFSPRVAANDVDEGDVSSMMYDDISAYYPLIRTREPVPGVAYTAANYPEAAGAPAHGWGKPTCTEFLALIVAQIRTDPDYQQSVAWYEAAFQSLAIPVTQQNFRSQVVDRYVNNALTSYVSDADRDVERGQLASPEAHVGRAISGAGAAVGNILDLVGMSAMIDSIIYGLHNVRAVLMLVVTMAIPIGMVISMYSPGFLLQGAVLLFSITFINALWAIASWVEGTLVAAIMPSALDIITDIAGLSADRAIKYAAINISTLLLYTLMPIAFFWMLSAAGARDASRSAGQSVGSGSGAGLKKGAAIPKSFRR